MTSASNFFVDGPNVDGVLGCILGRCPLPRERPRWDEIKRHLSRSFSFTGRPTFVLDQRHFTPQVYPFHRFLRSAGFECRPVDKVGRYPGNDDPVDEFILDRLLDAANAPEADRIQVALCGHDHIYAPFLAAIMASGGRVVICGFREELSPALLDLEGCKCEIFDLEHDLGGFTNPLPRPYRPVCRFAVSLSPSHSQIQRNITNESGKL